MGPLSEALLSGHTGTLVLPRLLRAELGCEGKERNNNLPVCACVCGGGVCVC